MLCYDGEIHPKKNMEALLKDTSVFLWNEE